MKELFDFLKQLIQSQFLFIVVLGVVLLVMGLAGGVTYKGILLIAPPWNFVVAVVGLGFVVFGALRLRSSERSSSERTPDWVQKLYTFHGLSEELKPGSRNEEFFQDFKIDRHAGRNLNGVYFLWADTYMACQINAEVNRDETGDHFLRVTFVTNPDSYVSNLAIHPQDRRAFNSTRAKRYLRFAARIPEINDGFPGRLETVGIHIRLVNGYLQHWENASAPQEWCKHKITGSEWRDINVDLSADSDWILFKSDGNHRYGPSKSDFSIIANVIFAVGRFTQTGTLGDGAGVVDIKSIRLVD